jgi:hypothetical protein
MTEPRDQLRPVRQWLEKAEHDLLNAEHTLTIRDEECPFDTVCFHAQHSYQLTCAGESNNATRTLVLTRTYLGITVLP